MSQSCQQCACSYGRVMCTRVECEATFCLSHEIQVKKEGNECCVECRAPAKCSLNQTHSIDENQIWINESAVQKQSQKSCEICECTSSGQLKCFQKSCQKTKYPNYALLKCVYSEPKSIDANTIPFLADFIKSFDPKSNFYVTNGPFLSSLFNSNDKIKSSFTLDEVSKSKINYQVNPDSDSSDKQNDFVVLTFISTDNRTIENILIEFEIQQTSNINENGVFNLDRTIRDHEPKPKVGSLKQSQQTPRKTIFIQPGEAIKLTSSELKPRVLPTGVTDKNLVYFLVSSSPKYGELKLKKLFGINGEEAAPAGWSKVNDLYLEKSVKEFTQTDLDNGNVWYEPLNDFTGIQNDQTSTQGITNLFAKKCRTSSKKTSDLSDEDYDTECVEEPESTMKYDHCLFEVYDQTRLGELISKEVIHFSVHNEVINETLVGVEAIEGQLTPLASVNFDVAGIDSSREHLVYRVIKALERAQGQLEHKSRPGVVIDTFTQADLNRGLVMYQAPKEIGTAARDFLFTFVGKSMRKYLILILV
jgi:hypothetical protein